MARPVGSKNRVSTAPKAVVAPQSKITTASVLNALSEFRDAQEEGYKKTTEIMSDLAEKFETLEGMVEKLQATPAAVGSNKSPAVNTSQTKPSLREEREVAPPDFDTMGEKELQQFIEANALEEEVDLLEHKSLSKKRAAVEEAYALLQDSPGEEDEAPSVNFDTMDADALQDFVDDNNLDVSLEEYKTISKKRAAVEEAYEAVANAPWQDDND